MVLAGLLGAGAMSGITMTAKYLPANYALATVQDFFF